MSEKMQNIAIQIIIHGGEARTKALEAIRQARAGDFKKALELLSFADQSLVKAHHEQTDLIQGEARGDQNEVTLFMVHAQDHLMNAMTVRDLAEEMIHEIQDRITFQKDIQKKL